MFDMRRLFAAITPYHVLLYYTRRHVAIPYAFIRCYDADYASAYRRRFLLPFFSSFASFYFFSILLSHD